MLTLNEIRSIYLKYFEKQKHLILPSSSLVPDDPTLMFTNSGMVQLKDFFAGLATPPSKRITTCQKSVRAGGKHNDLENVGYTARHHTFFEMLGNFSIGDYFKKDAITWAWDLLLNHLNLPPEKLLVTVYHTDDEAIQYWKDIAKLPDDKIIRIKTKDNFWEMGDTGPCGPCTEIFYDHGEEIEGGVPGSENEDGDRYIEIWNNVFTQFERQPDGSLKDLKFKNIDTGMGLERVAAVLQGVHNNYDIDLFQRLIENSKMVIGDNGNIASHRVIADHLRSSSFLIADGVLPSNEGRGYVLRRIMRRAMRHIHQLGSTQPSMFRLVPCLVDVMGDAYPELKEREDFIMETLEQEEVKFRQTLDRGLNLLEKEIAEMEKDDNKKTTPPYLYGIKNRVVVNNITHNNLEVKKNLILKERIEHILKNKTNYIHNIIINNYKIDFSSKTDIRHFLRGNKYNKLGLNGLINRETIVENLQDILLKSYYKDEKIDTKHNKIEKWTYFEVKNININNFLYNIVFDTFQEKKGEQNVRYLYDFKIFKQKENEELNNKMDKKMFSLMGTKPLIENIDINNRGSVRNHQFPTAWNPTLDNTITNSNLEVNKKILSGLTAFTLYDTYGFPLDLTQDILRSRGIEVDIEGFEKAMQEQKERSKWGGTGDVKNSEIYYEIKNKIEPTEFLGYDNNVVGGKILALIKDGKEISEAKEGDDIEFFVDKTSFYAEMGGQCGDSGIAMQVGEGGRIQLPFSTIEITDVKQPFQGYSLHKGRVESGAIKVGDFLNLAINMEKRNKIKANHSAIHLLEASLRKIYGDNVVQKGSSVNDEGARYDFALNKAVSKDDLRKIEFSVNQIIEQKTSTLTKIMPIEDAKKTGAVALFGEKYGDMVRVLFIGEQEKAQKTIDTNSNDIENLHSALNTLNNSSLKNYYSIDFCGGTHVKNTGEIGAFKIINESSIASGVRRIEILTGLKAMNFMNKQIEIVEKTAELLECGVADVFDNVSKIADELKSAKKELNASKKASLNTIEFKEENVNDVVFASIELDVNAGDLKGIFIDKQNKKYANNSVMVAIANFESKSTILIGVSKDLNSKLSAKTLISEVGKGGGQDWFAMGSIENKENVIEKLKAKIK